jgi:hypothetical protein
MRIKEFKTITFGTTDLETIESSLRHIQDVTGLLTISGLSTKVSKKYVLIVDATRDEDIRLGYKSRTWSGTDKLETALKKLKELTESTVVGHLHPEIIVTK